MADDIPDSPDLPDPAKVRTAYECRIEAANWELYLVENVTGPLDGRRLVLMDFCAGPQLPGVPHVHTVVSMPPKDLREFANRAVELLDGKGW